MSDDDDSSVSEESKRRVKKKVRSGPPLALELAVPFLAAGDLNKFASLNRTCSHLARVSLQKRLETPLELSKLLMGTAGQPTGAIAETRVYSQQELPDCYKKDPLLFCWASKRGHFDLSVTVPVHISMMNGNNKNNDMACCWKLDPSVSEESLSKDIAVLRLQKFLAANNPLPLPSEYHSNLANAERMEIRHLSVIDQIATIIMSTKTTSADDDDDNDDERGEDSNDLDEFLETTRLQLFLVVYDLTKQKKKDAVSTTSSSSASSSPQSSSSMLLYCKPLTEDPVDRGVYGHVANNHYGQAVRSANGNVLAILTALPMHDDGDPLREDFDITIFSLTTPNNNNNNKKKKKNYHVQKIHETTINSTCDYDAANIDMALSNGGEVLSIRAEQDEESGGSWSVLNLATTSTSPSACSCGDDEIIFVLYELPTHSTIKRHYFTPDNELVVHLGGGGDDGFDREKFVKDQAFPRFAKRLIFWYS